MISHHHRCIFIHIPKCAGTSIETALGHFDGHQGRGGQDHRTIRMLEPLDVPKILTSKDNMLSVYRRQKDIMRKAHNPRNKYTVTAEQYQQYFKFTIVRNPWARVFSWYKNATRDKVHRQNAGISADIPFSEYLSRFAGVGMLEPQTYWLKRFNGNVELDYIGRFETLAQDYSNIAQTLGLSDTTLPHKMQSRKEDYRQHYDDATAELVADRYAEEIALFDYSFDDVAHAPASVPKLPNAARTRSRNRITGIAVNEGSA